MLSLQDSRSTSRQCSSSAHCPATARSTLMRAHNLHPPKFVSRPHPSTVGDCTTSLQTDASLVVAVAVCCQQRCRGDWSRGDLTAAMAGRQVLGAAVLFLFRFLPSACSSCLRKSSTADGGRQNNGTTTAACVCQRRRRLMYAATCSVRPSVADSSAENQRRIDGISVAGAGRLELCNADDQSGLRVPHGQQERTRTDASRTYCAAGLHFANPDRGRARADGWPGDELRRPGSRPLTGGVVRRNADRSVSPTSCQSVCILPPSLQSDVISTTATTTVAATTTTTTTQRTMSSWQHGGSKTTSVQSIGTRGADKQSPPLFGIDPARICLSGGTLPHPILCATRTAAAVEGIVPPVHVVMRRT